MSVYRSGDGATRVKNRIVGQMIRELRLKSGVSQATLGEKIGLSRFVIMDIENGIRSLKDDEARILEQAFDLEEHYFDSTSHYLKRVKTEDAGNVEKYFYKWNLHLHSKKQPFEHNSQPLSRQRLRRTYGDLDNN